MSAEPNYSKRWELAGYLSSAHVDAIMTGLSIDNHMSIDEVAYNRGKECYHIEHPRDWVLSKPKPNYSKRWELAGYLGSAHVDAIMTGLSLDNHMSIDEAAYNRGKERYHIEHPRDWVLSKPKPTIKKGYDVRAAVTRPITPHDPQKCAYCAAHPETSA